MQVYKSKNVQLRKLCKILETITKLDNLENYAHVCDRNNILKKPKHKFVVYSTS